MSSGKSFTYFLWLKTNEIILSKLFYSIVPEEVVAKAFVVLWVWTIKYKNWKFNFDNFSWGKSQFLITSFDKLID